MMLPTATATNGWKPSGMPIAGSGALEADYEKLKIEALRQQERIEQLEELCSDLYRIAAHEGYIGNELHNRLVELGFADGE